MMRKPLVLVVIAIVLTITGIVALAQWDAGRGSPDRADDPTDATSADNSSDGAGGGAAAADPDGPRFIITFPPTWQVARDQMGMAMIASAPLDDADDAFAENANINEIANPRGLGVQAFYDQQFQLDVARTKLKNFALVSEADAMIGGRPAKRTVYTHTAGQFDLTALVYTITTDTHGYVITCSVESEWFNIYRPIFEEAIATFRAR